MSNVWGWQMSGPRAAQNLQFNAPLGLSRQAGKCPPPPPPVARGGEGGAQVELTDA